MEHINNKIKITYAIGGLGKNIAYGIVSSYTLYYYNTVLGISGAFVGLLLMVARIFDALNDPLMGVVVAKTRSRWGKYKPWIFSGTLLNALVLAAMFSVPEELTENGVRWYITVTYFLCGITYTLSDIPFWSVIPAITRAGAQREQLTVFARALSGIGAALPMIFTVAVVDILGGGTGRAAQRIGFSKLSILIAAFYVLTMLLMMKYLPREEQTQSKTIGVGTLLKSLVKNDMAISVAAIIMLFFAATYLTSNLVVYIFEYDMGSKAGYTVYMMIGGIAQFSALTVGYSLLRKKFSNRAILGMACGIAAAGYLIFTLLIFTGRMTIAKLLLPGICISLANGAGYVLTTILIADAVDYGEKQSGFREESMVSSMQTLMVKMSSAFSAFIAGIGVDLAGIQEGAVQQQASAVTGLRVLFSVPPLVLMIAAAWILYRKKNIGLPATGGTEE